MAARGVELFSAALAEDVDFKGEPANVKIDGAPAYRQAISLDGLVGEALFVLTDEGTTFVLVAMPGDDARLQKTVASILDSAELSPGTRCTITLMSDGSITDTVLVYDYGKGASCTLNVEGANTGEKTPTSGRVLTGWEADDPNVSAELNDQGKWYVTGVTSDVTLSAVWTTAHKVTFTDGTGNTIATVGVLDGEAADAPDEPTREGFAFAGWDADFSKVSGDLTVNATWERAPKE